MKKLVNENKPFELLLNHSQTATLLLHMNIMRKPIKKGFKSNYGLLEGRKQLKLYDEIKDRIQNDLECFELEIYTLPLTKDQLNMLQSFVNWYVLEIKVSAETQGKKIGKEIEKDEQIIVLEEINEKINALVSYAAEMLIREMERTEHGIQ